MAIAGTARSRAIPLFAHQCAARGSRLALRSTPAPRVAAAIMPLLGVRVGTPELNKLLARTVDQPFVCRARKDPFGADCPKVGARTQVARPTMVSSPVASHPWPPNPRGGERFGRYHHREPTIVVGQRLAYGIALIVVPASWERKELCLEICEP